MVHAALGDDGPFSFFRGLPTPVCLLLAGCTDTPVIELEVYSWWGQTSEARAFEQIEIIHERDHPDVNVVNRAERNSGEQREQMAQLLLTGAPPATFTANIGADLLRWAVVETQSAPSAARAWIRDVSGVVNRTSGLATLPTELRRELTVGTSPGLYGVPINIHRLNVLYYNEDRMQHLARDRSIDELLSLQTLCPESGEPDLPAGTSIAIGVNDDFALIMLAFENVLPAIAGPTFYDDLFRGRTPQSATQPGESYLVDVRRALECVQKLSKYFTYQNEKGDPRNADEGWARALGLVANGAADFTVMGDWANGELNALGTNSVKAIPFPGTENTFVFTSDTFPLPIGAKHEAEIADLLATIASPEAQSAFSRVKGSIPAWFDARGLAPLSPEQSATREDFKRATVTKVLATSGLFPPYYRQDELGEALRRMIATDATPEDLTAALAEFDSQEPLLGQWQGRLSEGAPPPRLP